MPKKLDYFSYLYDYDADAEDIMPHDKRIE